MIVHGQFTIDRHYPLPPDRVFGAFADPAIRRRWFAEGEGWEVETYDLDLRPGGHETSSFRYRGGPRMENRTVVHEVVTDTLIVSTYVMAVDGKTISVSLTTTEFEPEGDGTGLRFTEQGVYFDDPDALANREEGTRELLEALAEVLERD